MTAAAFEHVDPWSEDEFLSLGETSDQVELFDGSLLVSPAPTPRHQDISSRLWLTLRPVVDTAGLHVHQHVNVRLKLNRIPIPDLVVVEPVDGNHPYIRAASVHLVAEIVSPTNPAADRVLKMHYYAEAGIPYYLLVEQQPLQLRLFRLEDGHYVLGDEAEPGRVLRIAEPIRWEIDPAVLG